MERTHQTDGSEQQVQFLKAYKRSYLLIATDGQADNLKWLSEGIIWPFRPAPGRDSWRKARHIREAEHKMEENLEEDREARIFMAPGRKSWRKAEHKMQARICTDAKAAAQGAAKDLENPQKVSGIFFENSVRMFAEAINRKRVMLFVEQLKRQTSLMRQQEQHLWILVQSFLSMQQGQQGQEEAASMPHHEDSHCDDDDDSHFEDCDDNEDNDADIYFAENRCGDNYKKLFREMFPLPRGVPQPKFYSSFEECLSRPIHHVFSRSVCSFSFGVRFKPALKLVLRSRGHTTPIARSDTQLAPGCSK